MDGFKLFSNLNLNEKGYFQSSIKTGYYYKLKPKQHNAIVSYVTGNETFVVLPTGYGKSLVYAILPLTLV